LPCHSETMTEDDQAPVAAKVVYITTNLLGYLNRFLPIGADLQRRGVDVTVVSASTRTIDLSNAAGFRTVHLAEEEDAMAAVPDAEPWTSRGAPVLNRLPGTRLGQRASARRHWQARARALDTTELSRVLRDLDPDLVVTETEQHREIRVTAGLGIPLLLFEDFPTTRPGPGVPFPSRNLTTRFGDRWKDQIAALSWHRFFLGEFLRRHAERFWVDGHDWSSVVENTEPDVFAASPTPLGPVSRRYTQRYDYGGLTRIRTVAPELCFPGEPQPPIVVGPIVDPDRPLGDVDAEFTAIWETILEATSGRRPLVYVTIGTFLAGLSDLTATIIRAARELPEDPVVVVAAGRDFVASEPKDPTGSVHVFARVPQMQVLEHADVIVTTGGSNTGNEAVWFGVPMLTLPVAGVDPPGNAARSVHHGLGLSLIGSNITQENLRNALARLLREPGWAQRCTEAGRVVRSWNAVSRAADVIIEHLP